MALVGVPACCPCGPALVLNLFVASIVTVRFAMAGHLPWRSLVPLAIGSVPAAFIGGSIDLPGELYRPLVAAVLVVGATAARNRPASRRRRGQGPASHGSPASSAARRSACSRA